MLQIQNTTCIFFFDKYDMYLKWFKKRFKSSNLFYAFFYAQTFFF